MDKRNNSVLQQIVYGPIKKKCVFRAIELTTYTELQHTGHNNNTRLPTIKITKKKLSADTGMGSSHVDSDDNTNWQ